MRDCRLLLIGLAFAVASSSYVLAGVGQQADANVQRVQKVLLDLLRPSSAALTSDSVDERLGIMGFSPDVQGQVSPLGRFDGHGGVADLHALADAWAFQTVTINALTPEENLVFIDSTIFFMQPNGTTSTLRPIPLKGVFAFNQAGLISGFDLILLRMGLLFDPEDDSEAEENVEQMCQQIQDVCTDVHLQYNSTTECEQYMLDISYGTWQLADQDNAVCRILHTTLAGYSPSDHCPAVGRTGGGRCRNRLGTDYRLSFLVDYPLEPLQIYVNTTLTSFIGTKQLESRTPQAQKNKLTALMVWQNMLNTRAAPIVRQLTSGKLVTPPGFSVNVTGYTNPIGKVEGGLLAAEYFYGLALTQLFEAVTINAIAAEENLVWVDLTVKYRVTDAALLRKACPQCPPGTPYVYSDLPIKMVSTFDDQGLIIGYEGMAIRTGILFDPPDQPAMQQRIDTGCMGMQRVCTGRNRQYSSAEHCRQAWSNRPFGTAQLADKDDPFCRLYHLALAIYDPDLHCPHSGPSGGGKCVRKTAEQYQLSQLVGYPILPYNISPTTAL